MSIAPSEAAWEKWLFAHAPFAMWIYRVLMPRERGVTRVRALHRRHWGAPLARIPHIRGRGTHSQRPFSFHGRERSTPMRGTTGTPTPPFFPSPRRGTSIHRSIYAPLCWAIIINIFNSVQHTVSTLNAARAFTMLP